MNKKTKHTKIFESLAKFANFVPIWFYWLDTEGIVLGANDIAFMELGGLDTRELIVGKANHSFYPKEVAEVLIKNNEEVIKCGKTIEFEERIIDIHGNIKYLTSTRAPLRDDEGAIIGIFGTSVNITEQKKAEQLKLQYHNQLLQEQKLFTKLAQQVAHDIRSPLAALQLLVTSCTDLPEHKRNALRDVANRINEIADNLLTQYKHADAEIVIDEPQPVLVSTAINQIVAEKKIALQHKNIEVTTNINSNSKLAFISIEPVAFKRMLSNLINNASEAIASNSGHIDIEVTKIDNNIQLTLADNGCGMNTDLVQKIKENLAIQTTKESGHGIGLSQIRDTIIRNKGNLDVASEINIGTKFIITFPEVKAPIWMCTELNLKSDDFIVILDDDSPIHTAWDIHLEKIRANNPQIKIVHFEQAEETINFINQLSKLEKQQVNLLTDYELLKQNLNGLDVIERTNVTRSTLVTSHYMDNVIRERAIKSGIKILPKQLASEIEIYI